MYQTLKTIILSSLISTTCYATTLSHSGRSDINYDKVVKNIPDQTIADTKFAVFAHNDSLTIMTGIDAKINNLSASISTTTYIKGDVEKISPKAKIEYKISPNTTLLASYNSKLTKMSSKISSPTFAFATSYMF